MKTSPGWQDVATTEDGPVWLAGERVESQAVARADAEAAPLAGWRLEVWVERYTSMVYSLGLRMTGDAGWAEELTQDVFLELDRNRGRMRSEEHVRRWLRQVTMHRAVDALRRRNSREPGWSQGRWMGLEEWQETADERVGRGAEVERWLMQLPERQREAVLLRYQEAMTPEEIAAALRAPVATVKSQLQRGLKTLRRLAGVKLAGAGKEMCDAE